MPLTERLIDDGVYLWQTTFDIDSEDFDSEQNPVGTKFIEIPSYRIYEIIATVDTDGNDIRDKQLIFDAGIRTVNGRFKDDAGNVNVILVDNEGVLPAAGTEPGRILWINRVTGEAFYEDPIVGRIPLNEPKTEHIIRQEFTSLAADTQLGLTVTNPLGKPATVERLVVNSPTKPSVDVWFTLLDDADVQIAEVKIPSGTGGTYRVTMTIPAQIPNNEGYNVDREDVGGNPGVWVPQTDLAQDDLTFTQDIVAGGTAKTYRYRYRAKGSGLFSNADFNDTDAGGADQGVIPATTDPTPSIVAVDLATPHPLSALGFFKRHFDGDRPGKTVTGSIGDVEVSVVMKG